MTDYVPAIMKEINSLHEVDGFYTNAWPPLGAMPVCFCEQCRKLPASGTPAYWDKFNERTIQLWKLYDAIAKEKKPVNFYFANLGGFGIARCSVHLAQLGEFCRMVPGRQPGPRWRRVADLGLRDPGARLQRGAKRQNVRQRHRLLVHRHAALAQRL